jgi:hypothetical protein
MYYLVTADGNHEQALFEGTREEMDQLAQRLKARLPSYAWRVTDRRVSQDEEPLVVPVCPANRGE